MQMSEIVYDGVMPIEGYGPGFFRIGGQVIKGAVLVMPERAGQLGRFGRCRYDYCSRGKGSMWCLSGPAAEMSAVPASFRGLCEAVQLGVEPMPTPAACRTYNVLAAEQRRGAAGRTADMTAPIVHG